MIGSELSTEELRAWGTSRGLSEADTEQLVAVGEARDKLREELMALRSQLDAAHAEQARKGQNAPLHIALHGVDLCPHE